MSFTPWSAKFAKVRMNTAGSSATQNNGPGSSPVVLYCKQWEVTDHTDPADVTNFEGGGFGDWVATILDLDVSISDAEYDFAANVYDTWFAGVGLRAKSIVAAQLYVNDVVSSPYWYIPNLLILGNPMAATVRGTLKIPSITGKGKGTFTYPTGNFNAPT